MLKVFLGCLVSVVVLLSSACVPWIVPRAHAASANVLMTQIQAGSVGAPTQEFIVLYNNSPDDVNVTDWCLTNKSAVTIACFDAPEANQTIHLPAYGHAVIVSNSFAVNLPDGAVTKTYNPVNQNSGSIIGTSDTVSLLDETGQVVDAKMWTSPIAAGMQFERQGMGDPPVYTDTDMATDWSVTSPGVLPINETTISEVIVDHEVLPLAISELLPNAAGADGGKEFIEIFNPNDEVVSLSDYELHVGPDYEDSYDFPVGAIIQPGGYVSFTNAEIPFTLLNSSSRVSLTLRGGSVLSETPAYEDPKNDQSWADILGVWQYTNHPTPGAANIEIDTPIIKAETAAQIIAQPAPRPCAANQYRSPETSRCRLIDSPSTAPAAVTPCKDNQYRSEETHRCRNIVVAATVAPCKDGQERNPDTNRCRTIVKMPSADYGVLGAETKSSGNWYVWAAVGGVLLLAVGYAVWEWHDEMGKFFRKRYAYVLRLARRRK